MNNPKVFINPKSGSIRLTGTVDVVDSDGNLIETIENPKFCGCGHSQEKPFCDGSHKIITARVKSLENAAQSVTAIEPFNPSAELATQIRERTVLLKTTAHQSLVGLKIGGALESKENSAGVMIYGYLTDVMQVLGEFKTSEYIYPRAEPEIVFKLKQDISTAIELSEVLNFVSHVAIGMEIFDYRYGQTQIYRNDAVADNAGAAAFAYGQWVDATMDIFDGKEITLLTNSESIESAPLSAIRGNPWEAIVQLSQLAGAEGLVLKQGWIIFSGSATKPVHLIPGNQYGVQSAGLGIVEINTQ